MLSDAPLSFLLSSSLNLPERSEAHHCLHLQAGHSCAQDPWATLAVYRCCQWRLREKSWAPVKRTAAGRVRVVTQQTPSCSHLFSLLCQSAAFGAKDNPLPALLARLIMITLYLSSSHLLLLVPAESPSTPLLPPPTLMPPPQALILL